MRKDRKAALPLTWEEHVRWQEEDRLDEIEAAVKKFHEEQNSQRGKRDRGFGRVQQEAVIAAGAVILDQYGKREFPRTQHAMARAIADAAKEFGVELDPSSTSVSNVAGCMLELAHRLSKRKDP